MVYNAGMCSSFYFEDKYQWQPPRRIQYVSGNLNSIKTIFLKLSKGRSVRALRLDQHQLHRQKVSQALIANKSSDFWKEIRKVKGNGDTLPSVIDNMSNDEDII